jgi:hypothetical protein
VRSAATEPAGTVTEPMVVAGARYGISSCAKESAARKWPVPRQCGDHGAVRYFVLPQHTGIGALRLRHKEIPVPGPRQVLVHMRAWSLNHRDLLIAEGRYGRGVK